MSRMNGKKTHTHTLIHTNSKRKLQNIRKKVRATFPKKRNKHVRLSGRMYVCMYVTGKLVIADGCVEFCEATAIGLVDKPKVSLYGRETNQDCVAPVDASRDFIYFLRTSSGGRGGGMLQDFFFCSLFPVQ